MVSEIEKLSIVALDESFAAIPIAALDKVRCSSFRTDCSPTEIPLSEQLVISAIAIE